MGFKNIKYQRFYNAGTWLKLKWAGYKKQNSRYLA